MSRYNRKIWDTLSHSKHSLQSLGFSYYVYCVFWCCSSSAYLCKFWLVSLGITGRKKHGLWSTKISLLFNISLFLFKCGFFPCIQNCFVCLLSQILKPFWDFLSFFSWSIWLCFMSVFKDNFHLKEAMMS